MENFSSFGFFERWLIRWQKPNVLKCAAAFFGLWVTCYILSNVTVYN